MHGRKSLHLVFFALQGPHAFSARIRFAIRLALIKCAVSILFLLRSRDKQIRSVVGCLIGKEVQRVQKLVVDAYHCLEGDNDFFSIAYANSTPAHTT